MKSSGKIIIKPRAGKRSNAAARRATSEADSETQLGSVKEENETENDQMDADDENDHDNSNDDNDPTDQPVDDDSGAGDGNTEEEAAPAPVRRSRGRPRGSGPKSSGTSTPRGRPRGRGRGRGRGRATVAGAGLTIRLKAPKGEEGDVSDDEYTPEAEAPTPAAASTAAAEPEEEAPAKEAPMGGGKPFRKVGDKVYVIDGDEFITEDDPKGDEKIDKWGNLLGGMSPLPRTYAQTHKTHLSRAKIQGVYIRFTKSSPSTTVYAGH